MEGNQLLGIRPVPRQVGQVSVEFPFMVPYGGNCFRVFTFSVHLVRSGSGPSVVLLLWPGVTMAPFLSLKEKKNKDQ